ncbi:MAG: hypothetical protein WC404_04880 [Candidatus Omnitrophota bacterium]|jgi:hypothetical protein
MAKIGNESRLIIKLAEEKTKTTQSDVQREYDRLNEAGQKEKADGLMMGYRAGVDYYKRVIRDIALSLEG